ncbi:MarR family winged helix-turn-helix transcriptional regulator [Cupriavidus basilensis]|uniref:MarR family winged helix-turn-helix transcriptional regulator n=1 Tax=Cupriavidus TaxID=106589 RepID=UPI000445DD11|nr:MULTISPECIES: MarR family transcriptional regulator [Cupriavidus]KDP89522.1 transcriptional regulator [Cupriavidus sp. SK-3]MDF3884543.1 MarR family transcriptional regulator [Cupriavidus basilensis]
MELRKFFPYRLARVAEIVSQATAQVYAERFGLTRDEWRIVAALAGQGAMKTSWIMENSTLDKMRVSRALARLERDGLTIRTSDPEDGRAWLVTLQPSGTALYRKIVPMVEAREDFLLSALTESEREVLIAAIDKVYDRAAQLLRQG